MLAVKSNRKPQLYYITKKYELPLPYFLSIVTVVAAGITLSGLAVLHLSNRVPAVIPLPFTTSLKQRQEKLELIYNVRTPPKFRYSSDLQAIVDDIVNLAIRKGLPTESLSISLIDITNPKTPKSAVYQDQELRFPASVSKLFWLVALYAQFERRTIKNEASLSSDIYKMVQKSDNNAASRIIDQLTQTTSGGTLEDEAYGIWQRKRKSLNRFFQEAGYANINISQKNFPIPYQKLELPEGRDLQMRGAPSHLIRNKITSYHAARLMYEIFTEQAVSSQASQEMKRLLTRDLRPEVWQKEQYNSIKGFLGELLPINNVYFASKVGWTTSSRQDVAYIESKDGRARYILVIFGDHPAYAEDWDIFPEMSLLVFNRIVEQGVK